MYSFWQELLHPLPSFLQDFIRVSWSFAFIPALFKCYFPPSGSCPLSKTFVWIFYFGYVQVCLLAEKRSVSSYEE
ncbi:hypothetical protein SLEP1_g2842 [Rubroshorea leprosula]|uniref:Uncharacterized protein n=1 Tax=Rubroshorea leprosula TaxID=152421 RepID=A0AAV5HIG2_9ROSI|nr:hypothetical protein SLEP1_g2842 [Rubroshorea leprosula]